MKRKTTAVLWAWLFWPGLEFYLGRPGRGVLKVVTIGGFLIWAVVDAFRFAFMSEDDFNAAFNAGRGPDSAS